LAEEVVKRAASKTEKNIGSIILHPLRGGLRPVLEMRSNKKEY
jgi:hypothetical protein